MKDITKISENYESEEIIGKEDRVFADESGAWYWQARGSRDCFGPFTTKAQAIADYDSN